MPGFAAQYYGGIWGRRATLLSSWHFSVLCLKQSENVHQGKLVLWQFLLLTKYKICSGMPRNIMAGYQEDELYCYRSTTSRFCLNATYRCLLHVNTKLGLALGSVVTCLYKARGLALAWHSAACWGSTLQRFCPCHEAATHSQRPGVSVALCWMLGKYLTKVLPVPWGCYKQPETWR